MQTLGLIDWVALQRQRKWKWAKKLATSCLNSWAIKALTWDPSIDPKEPYKGRETGRPKTRWTDDINNYIKRITSTTTNTTTTTTATWVQWNDESLWQQLEAGYVYNHNNDEYDHENDNCNNPEPRLPTRTNEPRQQG